MRAEGESLGALLEIFYLGGERSEECFLALYSPIFLHEICSKDMICGAVATFLWP